MKKKFIIFIASITLLSIVIYALVKNHKVSSVICRTQYGPCDEALLNKLESDLPKNYFETRKFFVDILGSEALVLKYQVSLHQISKLRVDVIVDSAKLAVTRGENSGYTLLGSSGNVIGEVVETQLPKLAIADSIDDSDVDFKFLVDLLPELNLRFEIGGMRYTPESIEIVLDNGIRVLLPTEGDSDLVLGVFFVTLSQLNSEAQKHRIEEALGREVSVIDLRFNNPVLK